LTKERKLTFADLARVIDQHDLNWLARQSDEVQNEFSPLVAMRWATCVQSMEEAGYMLWVINQRVNHHLFAPGMDEHHDLSFRLLASCGLRNGVLSRTWLAGPRRGGSANPLFELLAEQHPMATDAELHMLLSLHCRDDIVALAGDCGRTKEQVKECLKVYDKLSR
jgi:hypothetical protein